jgi:hypothetical protein
MIRRGMARRAIPAIVLAVAAALFAGIRRLLAGRTQVGDAVMQKPTDDTSTGPDGAVRSVQGADIELPEEALAEFWNPLHLERLARTYWAFLSRCTLGLIKVRYAEDRRYVTLVVPWIRLLTFGPPEYEMDADRGIVRWRIEKGLLVASQGWDKDGYLEIDVRRLPPPAPGRAAIHVEVEIANFYPSIAHGLSRFVYANTQSRIHVIVTHGFLRRVAKRDLDESVTGRFKRIDEVPDPQREAERPSEPAAR